MSGCTETGKPRIAILMAVYEPRMDWLREQLLSLNAQTYPNLMLYIRDDCSPTVPFERIQSCAQDCIRAFPYEIKRNEKNLGSNGTFERLTQEAEGEYFAYCDQDDVWLPEKLEVLEKTITGSGALLVCSDMHIIDSNGDQTADSITKVRRHHKFMSGKDLAKDLLVSNFVTGCTMLVQAAMAKAATPFCPYMVHDHYIALWCAERGEVISLRQQLVNYRLHTGNQTNLMAGVKDKASYGKVRIDLMLARMQWLKDDFPCGKELKQTINDAVVWARARKQNWEHHGGTRLVWKYRRFSILPSVSEMVLKYVPDSLFMKTIQLARKNYI